jgi:hypothetical protein
VQCSAGQRSAGQERGGEGRGGEITTCAPVEERKEIDGRIDGWKDRQTDRQRQSPMADPPSAAQRENP